MVEQIALSVLYLVRHGQAGTRENYDSLSDLGRSKPGCSGEYFAAQGIRFEAAFSGSLARQRATAAEVAALLGRSPVTVDRGLGRIRSGAGVFRIRSASGGAMTTISAANTKRCSAA